MPQPNAAIRSLLLSAYPCLEFEFEGMCHGRMRWDPTNGHVPRGFCGATTGNSVDVKLVLVTAEPGNPQPDERYSGSSPEQIFESVFNFTYEWLEHSDGMFQKRIRQILEMCFPNASFADKMRQTWITDSVLCSAQESGGAVPRECASACRSRYFEKQIAMFPNAVIAALGGKAQQRLRGIGREFVSAWSAAPPGCNYPGAEASWQAIAACVRARFP